MKSNRMSGKTVELKMGRAANGLYHASSPQVPGFHVHGETISETYDLGLVILEETIRRQTSVSGYVAVLHAVRSSEQDEVGPTRFKIALTPGGRA